jgi:hypothetical protein
MSCKATLLTFFPLREKEETISEITWLTGFPCESIQLEEEVLNGLTKQLWSQKD